MKKPKKSCHKDCYECENEWDICCKKHCKCGGKFEEIGDIDKYSKLYQCERCKKVKII